MNIDPISRIRRFNRAVTTQVGALDNSFLGRARPLGVARVLNAVGHGIADIARLREYLGLDSGLMSRLLRTLEDEGLVETVPHPEDARRRMVELTAAGRREFRAYEKLSNAQASDIIAHHSRPDTLLAAMDIIACALGRDRIVIEETGPRSEEARYCLGKYYGELAQRLDCGFDVSLSLDPEAKDIMRPRGAFLVAMSDGLPIGCVGLKGTDHAYAEIKRLWVSPAARGLGIARDLMNAAEEAARGLSIDVLRLDTNSGLSEAVALYRKTGWTEIPRFNEDPYPDIFFEKRL